MIVEYSRKHNYSLIFASTGNLCVDLLWQLEFIHTFNTCAITLCVTWTHKECDWFGRYLTVVKVQLQWLENGSPNNWNHYCVPCLLFNWRKCMIQLITGWKQCGFSNIDTDERGFFLLIRGSNFMHLNQKVDNWDCSFQTCHSSRHSTLYCTTMLHATP